jgi:Anti-sigma-28 factor, FlgM
MRALDFNDSRADAVRELKRQIEAGEYRIDPAAVADAIVRRLRSVVADADADAGAGDGSRGPALRATPRCSRRLRTNARIRTARRRRR